MHQTERWKPGNVLQFYKFRKCPGKNIGYEKINLKQTKKPWINIMPLEENFDCREIKVLVQSWYPMLVKM